MHTTATTGGSCGTYKIKYHHAMIKGHPYHHGMPQAYRTGHLGHMKQKDAGAYGMQQTEKALPNLVDEAAYAGSYNTLLTAVKAAGLADALAGKGPYTVLAPTNEAFAKLPARSLDQLLANKAKLIPILIYHDVPGKLDASAVSGVSAFTTVEGSELPVIDIKITETGVMASNGVIHVIDEVLIPEA